VAVAACTGPPPPIPSSSVPFGKAASFSRLSSGSTPIQHIVLIVQENRTLNDLFATFPGANGQTFGYELVNGQQQKINLKQIALGASQILNHGYSSFLTAYDNGNMDGFNLVHFGNGRLEKNAAYVYVNPADVVPYWTMAEQYGFANNMFTTQGSASFSGHQALIRGSTCISSQAACQNPSYYSVSLIDNPPYSAGAWGCDSAPGTKMSLITNSLQLERSAGPFPCTNDFPYYPYTYETLRDLLDAKSVSWKYYTPKIGHPGAIWNAFDVIAPVRYGPEWTTNISSPETNVFNDISNGKLANVVWVIPKGTNSDHPETCHCDYGPSWVTSIVNAIGTSQYWNSTAIIVTWDDWGGFYDAVAPPVPRDNQGGPGLRVAMLVISPYAKIGSGSQGGYISSTFYEFGSIVRFIEDTFNLGRLGTTDQSSNSMADMFDFSQSPRQFHTIGSRYSRSFFVHQPSSDLPVDEQ
jgi:phospholipase C